MTMRFLFRWLASAVTTLIVLYLAPGITIHGCYHWLMIAVTIGLLNAVVPHLIGVFSFTTTLVTLGLATILANSLLIHLLHSGSALESVSIRTTILAAVMVSVMTCFITLALDSKLIVK